QSRELTAALDTLRYAASGVSERTEIPSKQAAALLAELARNAAHIKTAHGVARYSRIMKLSDFPPRRGKRGIKYQTAWLECGHLHESDAAERKRGTVYCG